MTDFKEGFRAGLWVMAMLFMSVVVVVSGILLIPAVSAWLGTIVCVSGIYGIYEGKKALKKIYKQ